MRREKRRLPQDEALRILETGEWGVLSTCGADGQPYGVPLNYVCSQGNIYFHCALEGRKLDNILHSSRVCFTVVTKSDLLPEDLSTSYRSVIAFGRARLLHGEEKREGIRRLLSRLTPTSLEKGMACYENIGSQTAVICIETDEISGKGAH